MPQPAGPAGRARLVPWSLALAVTMAALGVAWYFLWPVTPPERVATLYLDAAARYDTAAISRYAIRDEGRHRASAMSRARPTVLPTYTAGAVKREGDEAIVSVTATMPVRHPPARGIVRDTVQVVLVREGREWKVDPRATAQATAVAFANAHRQPPPAAHARPHLGQAHVPSPPTGRHGH